MSLVNFHAGASAQIIGNSELDAWMQTKFNRSLRLINGNLPVESIDPDHLPALVCEIGDGELDIQLGGERQEVSGELAFAVVWHEDDRDQAFTQRTELLSLIVKAIGGDHTLSGNVDSAWVSSYSPDQNILHPRHVFAFAVTGLFEEVPT